jgi:hypothetical protein
MPAASTTCRQWFFRLGLVAASWFAVGGLADELPPAQIAVTAYPSIQTALEANPGRMIFVPDREYPLTNAIVIRHSGSGLYGFGRLVQANSNAAIIEITGAAGVRIRDLTLTRAPGNEAAGKPALDARGCTSLSLANVRVIENRAPTSAISLRQCRDAEITGCVIENYSTLGVDDRTASPHYGYAFNCIDGTGIGASACPGLLIQGNRVIERRMRPTPELKEHFKLGQFVKRAAQKGSLVSQRTWDAGYVNNWHQGSAIVVTGPEESRGVRVLDNHIENAAQGIDLHADDVIVSGNIVVNSFMGLRAMHGSRHVLIADNQFIRNDLWAIGLMPGTGSHGAIAATQGTPAQPANTDGGHLVANNIISDFGHGDSRWMWGKDGFTRAPILFDRGQEPDDPPLRDVLVTGNLVFDSGRDGVAAAGFPQPQPLRYRTAVYLADGTNGPRGLIFDGNLFHSGREGISNRKLEP